MTTESDPVLAEMLSLGIPLVRPSFSLADRPDSPTRLTSPPKQPPRGNRRMSVVAGNLNAAPRTTPSLPVASPRSSEPPSNQPPVLAPLLASPIAKTMPPLLTSPISKSALPPPSMHNLTRQSSNEFSDIGEYIAAPSPSRFAMTTGRRNAAVSSGSSGAVSETAASVRTALELLALERNDDGEAFFRALQDKCINAVSKSGTIIDATQRVTMLFGQSTSQFNALQTEATSLRSQLYAELKSHVERAKLTQQQLQEAQRRESELKESLLKQQSIEASLQSQLAQRSSLLNSVRDSFLRQLLALKESIKTHVQPEIRDPVPDPSSPRPALRRAPSFMPAAPSAAPEQTGIDWQQLSKFLSDDERSMIALPSSDGPLNTASLIQFLTGSDQVEVHSKPVESGISTQRERHLLEKIQRLELQLHKQHSQMEEVTSRAAQTVADQSGLQSRMTEAIQLAKLSEQKLNEVEQLSSKQGARISALQTEVATLKRQASDMRIAFEAEEFRMKKEFVSDIEKLKLSISEKDATIAQQKEQIQEMIVTQVNSAQSKQLQMRLEALNEALSGGVETSECAVQCTTNNTDHFDDLPTLSGVTVLDSANDAAIALQEPIKSSPKSSPRAGSPTPSAVRVVVLSCESVATRDNSSVERALIAKLEYLRKINRFDEQHDKNRVVTAGELSQKETLQNDINIAQKQLNQVLDDLRRTQADLVKADAEYQLKLTQLNSIRNKRTNDKAKDQQIEADGRSKMKDGLIAWQLQQITAYEHALREAFGTVRILKTQISAFHLYFDRLQLQPINKQPLDYYHSHRTRRSMGVQASLLIPAPLPAASPAASPSPSPLTIDTTMSPTNKSADKARSPLSPRGRRTSVGSSPIGSPTSPTAADRSPTNDRRALRRGNSKLTANSIMSLVVAEETNDTIGESDPDDSVIGIEVTPQERKQRTMSDNIHLLVADWSSDESDSDTENVEIVSEEQLEKLKAEAAERLKLARSTSMLGVSVEKGASRSDIAAVANATAQLSAQASWWLRKSSDISSLTSPHAVMPTTTTAELFATSALASKTQKKGAIDGVIRSIDKRGKTVIRRTPAEQRLVDQRAARVARNWRRMFRYVRLRQAFSGWSAEKIKWSLEQTGEVPETHDDHELDADSSPLNPASESTTVQFKSSSCQTELTSTEIESLTRRANFKTPDRSFKPTANTPTVALVHMPSTSTAVQPNNGAAPIVQFSSNNAPSKFAPTPATPQADNQYGSPLPSPQGTVNTPNAADKTSATSIPLDFPDTVSQPTTDSVQVPATPRSAASATPTPLALVINTDIGSDTFVSDTASPIHAAPSGSPLADDMPEIDLDGRFMSNGTQTMCTCACSCSEFTSDYRLQSNADATARALSRDRTPLGKLPRKPVQDIIVRPSPVPKVYQAPPMLPSALPLQPLSDVTHSTVISSNEEQSLSVVDMSIQLGDTVDFSRTHRAFHTQLPPKSPSAPPLPRTTPADPTMSPRQHSELQAELSIAPAPTTDNPAAALHTSALLPSPIPVVPIHIVQPISIGLRGSFRRPRTAVNHMPGTVPEQLTNRASTPDPAVAVLDSLHTQAPDPIPRIEPESTVSIVDVGLVDQPSVELLSTQVQNHPEQLLLAATTELGDRLLAAFETPAPIISSQTPTPSSSLWTPRADHVVPARAPANSSYSNRLAQSKLHSTMSEATFVTPSAPTALSSIAALTSSGLVVQIKPSRPLSSPLMRHMAISASAMAARHPTSAGTVISSDKQTLPIETGVLMRVSPAPTAQRVIVVPQPPDSARVDEVSSPAARSRRLTALKHAKPAEAGKENTAASTQ